MEDLKELEQRIPSRRILGIPGVSVTVTLDGETILPTDTGYLAILTGTGEATFTVKIAEGYSFIGYDRAENGKHVTQLRNAGGASGLSYRRTVPVFAINNSPGCFSTDPKSAIWLFGVTADGRTQVYTISLTTQENECYLLYWKLYDEQCYRKGADAVCPELEGKDGGIWAPEVTKLLAGVEVVPDVAEYRPKPTIDRASLPNNEGVVDWYTGRFSIGVVVTKKGNARVHESQCPKSVDGLRYVMAGERVRFAEIVPRTEGHKPNPPWQVLGVTLL